MKQSGRFGKYGGIFVPEILFGVLSDLEDAFFTAIASVEFNEELSELLKNYAGRPTPLYLCKNLCADTKAKIYLKREDLLHGGAHKTNQVLGQALLAKKMGKKRLIAETGAGQHGVATSIVGALFGFETCIYMGTEDMKRQAPNVFRMELLGAEVVPVSTGSKTLKAAINEALRDWTLSFEDTHYLLGTVVGPHPFPTMVKKFQSVIGKEAKEQILSETNKLPDEVIACVGGGSNAIGIFSEFIENSEVKLTGVEAYGKGLLSGKHGATMEKGTPGILHGACTLTIQDENGQIKDTHSISAGLDYPGVGPEHVHLKETKRANYTGVTDDEALSAFYELAKKEGIICALESAHALAYAIKRAQKAEKPVTLLVNLSGRGDKDVEYVASIKNS